MGYNSIADIIGLSLFVWLLLPPKFARFGEILTKCDLTAVHGHPRPSILMSMEILYV